MKEMKKFDNWIGILSISIVVIIVLAFISTVSNTHMTKGTYGASESGDCWKCDNGDSVKWFASNDYDIDAGCSAMNVTGVTQAYCSNLDSAISGNCFACGSQAKWSTASSLSGCTKTMEGVTKAQRESCIGYCDSCNVGSSTTVTSYSIYFEGNGGTGASPINCVRTHDNITNTNTYTCGGNSDNTITLPTSSKSGYTFTGWSQGNASCSNPLKGTIKPTVTTTYYACFVETANGGTHAPTGVFYVYFKKSTDSSILKTCTTGTDGILDSSCISSAISICSTWNTKSDGTGTSYNKSLLASAQFTAATNLYCNTGSNQTAGNTPTNNSNTTSTNTPTITPTNNSNNSNTSNNPQTGTVGIIIAWVVGLSAIVYSLWYFKKSSSIN